MLKPFHLLLMVALCVMVLAFLGDVLGIIGLMMIPPILTKISTMVVLLLTVNKVFNLVPQINAD